MLMGASQIGVPMYITETGICDHTSLKRPAFFAAYFDEVRVTALPPLILVADLPEEYFYFIPLLFLLNIVIFF